MTVYVDEARHRYGRMIMCHMIADTELEMHDMARAIGVHKRHYQWEKRIPHYDICKEMRAKAVALGAQEVTSKQLVEIARRRGLCQNLDTVASRSRKRS